jgi:hypothetical protein
MPFPPPHNHGWSSLPQPLLKLLNGLNKAFQLFGVILALKTQIVGNLGISGQSMGVIILGEVPILVGPRRRYSE